MIARAWYVRCDECGNPAEISVEGAKSARQYGNTIKYISRAGKKDPAKEIEDLRKARWYLDDRIKRLESG